MTQEDWKIIEYEEIESSNAEAKRLVNAGETGGGVVVWARNQTHGRGRRGRSWWSAPGKSLTASFIFEGIEGAQATRLLSVSVVAAVRAGGGRGPLIKWPNDLVYGGRKAAGILTESFGVPAAHFAVVGIGINVGCSPAELDIPARLPATSLLVEEELPFDIRELLDRLIAALAARTEMDVPSVMEEYRGLLAYKGERVSVTLPPSGLAEAGERTLVSGILAGVDDDGALLLSNEGTTSRVVSGEMLIQE
ncbi:MAG: biotin--[acetyl-CoA-carboxylase] ligase [Candidatus Geothermincolia bacterium]